MDISKAEVLVLENIVAIADEDQVRELVDLQLAFVGGGIAELVGA
jgi:hypothetical protein